MRIRSASERFAISTRAASTFIPTRCWPVITCIGFSGPAGLMEATSNASGCAGAAVVCANRGVAKSKNTTLVRIPFTLLFFLTMFVLLLIRTVYGGAAEQNVNAPSRSAQVRLSLRTGWGHGPDWMTPSAAKQFYFRLYPYNPICSRVPDVPDR